MKMLHKERQKVSHNVSEKDKAAAIRLINSFGIELDLMKGEKRNEIKTEEREDDMDDMEESPTKLFVKSSNNRMHPTEIQES